MNAPLTEQDILRPSLPLPYQFMVKRWIELEKVQSAKRLAKEKIDKDISEASVVPLSSVSSMSELAAYVSGLQRANAIIDACFQIPDGDDEG
jgi:hypothetical protein